MPAISKIRLTNVVYEEGKKRYNDELFFFDGYNGAILLENGGGKTVFIQTVLQAIIPHTDLAERKIKNTLVLENAPAHIAIEWLINERPRRYVVTAVTLFTTKDGLDSLRYVYEYGAGDTHSIEEMPFVREGKNGKRPAEKGEMQDYYSGMRDRNFLARTFSTIKEYRKFIEEQYHIIAEEWDSIVKINSSEGGVEAFFDDCKSTNQLFDRLLIPTVENSIAGHDPKMFADMFEKRHESLKQYKKLKETIEENKRIQAELEKYVATFEKLHIAKLAYDKTKQRAKGIWEEIQMQKSNMNEEHHGMMQTLAEWQSAYDHYQVKKASYQIAIEKSKFTALEKEYEEVYANFSQREEELANVNRDYYSLKLAKLKLELKNYQDELTMIEKEIEKLDQTEELEDLEIQLEEAKRSLLGYFVETMDEIKKEISQVQYELNPIQEQIEVIQKQLDEAGKLESEKQKETAAIENQIRTRQTDLAKLEQLLLANPKQQKVESEYKLWQDRYQFLDEEVIRLTGELKQLEHEQKEISKIIEELKTEREQVQNSLNLIENDRERIDYEQRILIEKLSLLRPGWSSLESIYDLEKSIFSRLEESIDILSKEKKELLYKERIAYRLVDDYGKQQLFFSDSYIDSHIKSWKNQFDYLLTGVEYLQTLDEHEYEKKCSYPLWSLTLITTNKSKPALQEKLQMSAEQLHFPIQVMTLEEAATVDIMTDDVHTWVIPLHWQKGMNEEAFDHWKTEIKERAKVATDTREAKEQELKKWETGLRDFQQFITMYPFEKVQLLDESRSEHTGKIDEMSRKIKNEEEKSAICQEKGKQITETISEYKEEMQGLERNLERAMEYFQYVREIEEAKKKEKQLLDELENIQRKMTRWNRQLTDYQMQEKSLVERKRDLESSLRFYENLDEYRAVRSYSPIFTGESKLAIQEKMNTIQLKLQKISKSYGEWKARRENAIQNINRVQLDMDELRKEQSQLNEEQVFPSDGEQLMENTRRLMVQLAKEVKRLDKMKTEKLAAKEGQKGKWQLTIDQFQRNYPDVEIVEFTEATLDEEKDLLVQEKRDLDEKKQYIDTQLSRIQKEIQSINEAEREMDRFIEKHHFDAPNIEATPLNADEKMAFTYHRKPSVQSIIRELESARENVDGENKNVGNGKQTFRQFCQTISDFKMRKMAENGVDFKDTYDELLEFQRNMVKRIEIAINYANESIRKEDAALQAFINQIHTHLTTIVEELREIPRKTKVKVGDDWKTIYSFSIPEWEEEEGKKRIRDYIEWILTQLESERYIKPDGSQDDMKIRKDIEMWLQSKQLLQNVMKNEAMKVSCRKVTNENKVTTRSYSWEQSNVWSGGEKWSKNMTLFLGILNYVAEKKKQNRPNTKLHRAVILDNPFGKASSDHVLSPVFFVAEQLGFQIITLTAHAEGKFLQDYFPIIYSCRLRESNDNNKQVMTKEQWLHRAYFQDHDPVVIERLGQTEQLSLFDM
ncbi:coiled-coil domain-containing protein [Caldifermentibacillus hisashii]|uniref:hypothetical protein n=1 Tax=Caldifermentibacillus hisashii TaxID=996558 RepID=UPI000BA42259|nr:hypothetical protein [Caldifermentibacillus hisashii]PAC37204.1 hypothetical protein CEJ87_03725 [Caldifermentibacillus hisashii]